MRSKLLVLSLFLVHIAAAQAPLKSVHPQVMKVVEDVSEERIAAIMKRLEAFGSRNTNYDIDSPDKGIVAARKWIHSEFSSFSPRLQVAFDTHRVTKQGRIVKDLDVVNVVATLPGTSQKDQEIVICAHYDSLNMIRKANATPGGDATDVIATAEAKDAPGVSDNASGVALVMELARLMSQHEWEKTIVFIAFAGEEQGLFGSRGFSKAAKELNRNIVGVFNSDIIGNDYDGEGRRVTDLVNVYSPDPMDSPSRALARYVKDMGERYFPAMKANPVFRNDRFGRGGDHTPFADLGYAAIRFTTPVEHYGFQHSAGDTFEHSSPAYATKVTRLNAAAAGSLALAPATPLTMRSNAKGVVTGPNLARGKGYDAALKWAASAAPDIAGYVVTLRSTTSPMWEREIFVGNVTEYSLKGISIDDIVLGVKAVDKDGLESPVAAYNLIPRNFSNPAANPAP
jgi:hypothetical protein